MTDERLPKSFIEHLQEHVKQKKKKSLWKVEVKLLKVMLPTMCLKRFKHLLLLARKCPSYC